MGTLRFFEEVVSFKIRRTFGFADYILTVSFIVSCSSNGGGVDVDRIDSQDAMCD